MKNECKISGHGPRFMPATPIFQKHNFFKNVPTVENLKKNFIFDNHLIGLLSGILNVYIPLVYPEKLKENVLLLDTL